jgi:hypothetical protein
VSSRIKKWILANEGVMIKVGYYNNDQYGNLASEKIAVEQFFIQSGSEIDWRFANDHHLFGIAYLIDERALAYMRTRFPSKRNFFEIKA